MSREGFICCRLAQESPRGILDGAPKRVFLDHHSFSFVMHFYGGFFYSLGLWRLGTNGD